MEFRVLQYFLTIVREGSINRAAQVLHVTQPTLSRQIARMEEELGVKLFSREGKRMILTGEGLLLQRRAEEILTLVGRTQEELLINEDEVEGTIAVGCGELAAVEDFAETVREFQRLYPAVRFDLITAGADVVKEQLEKGLMDIGILLAPIEIQEFDFIRLKDRENWIVLMPADDPLARKERLTAEDLKSGPLILPRRPGVKNEIENWFGPVYRDLDIRFNSNLTLNSTIMADHGLGRTLVIGSAPELFDPKRIISRPLDPELRSDSLIVWRKYLPYQTAMTKFVDYIRSRFKNQE